MKFALVIPVSIALASCHAEKSGKPQTIRGNYQLVSMLRPNTISTVQVTVINDFMCRYCAEFNEKKTALFERYAERIQVNYIDVISNEVTRKASVAHLLAQQAGRADEVRAFLFERLALSAENDIDSYELKKRFDVDVDAVRVEDARLLRTKSDIAYAVAYKTPTIILENQIAMDGNIENIEAILDQLLIATEHGGRR